MKRFLIYVVIGSVALPLGAQAPIIFNYGNKKTSDEFHDACRSQDGGILAVGASDAEAWNGWDATLMKIDYAGGLAFPKKRIGSVKSEDSGLAVAEDPAGKIWIGGYSDSMGLKTAWIDCRNPSGGPIWHKDLFKSKMGAQVQDLEVARDGKSMAVSGIKDGKAWYLRVLLDGTPTFTPLVFDNAGAMTALSIEKTSLVEGTQCWYLYGCGRDAKGDLRAFFLKIDPLGAVLGTLVLSDKKIQNTGRCLITTGGNLLGVGTAEVPPSQEEAFTWYVPANLDGQKSTFQSFGGKKTKGSRFDEAHDIIALDATTCLVVGSTRSHKPGANVSNMATWRVDHYGNRLEYDMADYGDKLEERALRIIRMYSGDVWLCGTQNDGGAIRDDRNFAFAKIESLSLPWGATARPDNIQFNPPKASPAIQPGSNGTLAIEVVNRADSPAEGMYITAQCPPDMPGCYAGVRFALPPLQAGERYLAQIPLWADVEAPPMVNDLKLVLSNVSGTPLAQKTTQLTVDVLKKPKINLTKAVSALSQTPRVTLGQSTMLEITFKNEGQADAKNTILTFAEPEGATLSGKTEVMVDHWPVGAVRKYNLALTASRHSPQSKIPLKIYLSGDNLDEQSDLVAVLEVSTEAEKIAEPTPVLPAGKVELETQWDDGNDALSRRTGRPKYELAVAISGNIEVNFSDVIIYHNRDSFRLGGVKSGGYQLKKKNQSSKYFVYHLNADVALEPGENNIMVVVKKGEKRAATAPLTVQYKPNQNTLHVVCIGVPDNTGQLKFTQKDARDMAQLFARQQGKIFGEVNVTTLTSADSTRAETISKTIREFRLMSRRGLLKSTDAILIFCSSHGIVSEEDGQFRLLGSNFDPGNEKYTSVSFKDDILGVLDTLSCHKFILLDACHSGAFGNKGGAKDLGSDYAEAILQLSKAARTTRVIASCGEKESSYEDEKWQNGAFTKVFKDLLGDRTTCAELDKDGTPGLSIGEVFGRLQMDVNQLVKKEKRGKSQTPFAVEGVLREGVQVWGY